VNKTKMMFSSWQKMLCCSRYVGEQSQYVRTSLYRHSAYTIENGFTKRSQDLL